MLVPTISQTRLGTSRETVFYPPYSRKDFVLMQALLDDACMNGVAALRFIHSDRITVTTVGE